MTNDSALAPGLIYLNSANLSPCPRPVLNAVGRYQKEFEENPTLGLATVWGKLWAVQSELAAFLGADPTDLFLRSNVTSALNLFLLGMPLTPGSEILVGEHEYGAIMNICRLRAERDGLSWRICLMPDNPVAFRSLTRQKLLDHFISQIGPATRLILLSHVVAGTGLILPLQELAAWTRPRGIYVIVDGAYAPGALPLNLSDWEDVDFYGCSLYKWMLAPKGTAFGWIPKRHQISLQALNAGWSTFERFEPFAAFGDGNRFQEKLLMAGCHDFSPFLAIHDTLAYWNTQGPKVIRRHSDFLRQLLDQQIRESLGWLRLNPKEESLRGPLLTYLIPSAWQSRGPILQRQLLEQCRIQINMVCLRNLWHIVFSPYWNNTEAEILEATQRMKSFFRKV